MDITVNRGCIHVPTNLIVNKYGAAGLSKVIGTYVIKYQPHIGMSKSLVVVKREQVGGVSVVRLPRAAIGKIVKLLQLTTASNNLKIVMALRPPAPLASLTTADAMPLYENQQIVLDYLYKQFYSNIAPTGSIGNVNLKMPAGSGKTRLGLGLAHKLGLKTLIVVPTDYLLQQWKDEVISMFALDNEGEGAGAGNDNGRAVITVGTYAGGKNKQDGDIVIGIINSLLKAPPAFFESFGLTIFDESHDYCSDTFSEIFWKAQSSYNLSLTATPDERKDKFDKALVYHFGPIIDVKTIPGYKADDDNLFTGEVEAIRYRGHDDYTKTILNEKTGILSVPHMIGQVVQDPYRNRLLVNKITELYKQGRHIYVFTDQRAHANKLRDLLKAASVHADCATGDDDGDGGCDDNTAPVDSPAVNQHVLMGGTKKEQMEEAKEQNERGSVILTTYGYSYRGVSIKHMDTLIIATPRASKFTQIIGRIKRKGSDTSIKRRIIDIVDCATPLKNQFSERKKAYIRENFAIGIKNTTWEDLRP